MTWQLLSHNPEVAGSNPGPRYSERPRKRGLSRSVTEPRPAAGF
jgi:hypothetical protein